MKINNRFFISQDINRILPFRDGFFIKRTAFLREMTKQNPLKYPQPLKIRNTGRIPVYRQQVFDIPGYDMRPRAPADIRDSSLKIPQNQPVRPTLLDPVQHLKGISPADMKVVYIQFGKSFGNFIVKNMQIRVPASNGNIFRCGCSFGKNQTLQRSIGFSRFSRITCLDAGFPTSQELRINFTPCAPLFISPGWTGCIRWGSCPWPA